jgi:hypothetical protein
MTRETANSALTVEVPFVQIKHHLDHAPRSQLCWFVVLLKLPGDVAVVASNAERTGNECHCRIQLRCRDVFEDLYVLESLCGGLSRGLLLS